MELDIQLCILGLRQGFPVESRPQKVDERRDERSERVNELTDLENVCANWGSAIQSNSQREQGKQVM